MNHRKARSTVFGTEGPILKCQLSYLSEYIDRLANPALDGFPAAKVTFLSIQVHRVEPRIIYEYIFLRQFLGHRITSLDLDTDF